MQTNRARDCSIRCSDLSGFRAGRRRFLKTATMVAAAGCLQANSVAMEPLNRNEPKFKYSLAAYSYRSLLQGNPPELSLFDFADDCARFGLEGTELTSYYFPAETTPDYLRRLRRHCFRLGLDISGTAVRNDFGLPSGPTRDKDIAHVKKWVDYAEIMGAPVIRIFAGHPQAEQSPAETHRLIVEGIEECCDYAGQHGVHLALENHGGPTSTAEGLLKLVKDVDSEWFGVNLDTGNFHSDDIYGDLSRVAPYALNVQVKVAVAGPDKVKRSTDYVQLADLLRKANYRGYVVLEYEESGDPRVQSRRSLDELRAAFS